MRSKHGQDKLAEQYVVRIGPQEDGGFMAGIQVNNHDFTNDNIPLLIVTIPNENQKPWLICVPLVTVMKKFKLDTNQHCGYAHGISLGDGALPIAYTGITKRNWLTRFSEHFREAERGSKKRFHQH